MRKISITYIRKRFFSALFTLWVALTVNFMLPRMMGGNPADYLASQTALGSVEYAERLKEQFGLDKSLPTQYFLYLKSLMTGDLGVSYQNFPIEVKTIVLKAIPWTLLIVLISTIIAFAVSWVLGTICAMKKGSFFDSALIGSSFYIQAIPYFLVGMFLVLLLGYYLKWFPMGHAMTPGMIYRSGVQKFFDVVKHAFLPVLSLVIVSLAGKMIMMRSNILQIMSEDYILLAQGKGLSKGKIMTKYAFRNALLPSFTGLMLNLGQAVGGAIATEMIFSYPGIGLTIMNAILTHDYPLIQGCFAIIAVSVVTMNFIADIIYPFIDPRVSLS